MSPTELSLVLASALLHAWWSSAIKGSGDPLVFNVLQEAVVFLLLAICLPWIPFAAFEAPVWRWLAVTSVAHALYFYWMSRALEHGDLTLVYPIARSTPALLPLVSVPLFGERLSAGGALGIAVVVAGIWLLHAGPRFDWRALSGPAARYAYLTLCATVAYSLADKGAMSALAAGAWESPLPRAAAYCVVLSATSGALFLLLALRRSGLRAVAAAAPTGLRAATFASLTSFLGYGLILKALETAPASYVVAARQTSVIFAIGFGVLRLRERPDRGRIAGAVATVAGVALIAWLGS